MSAIAMMDQPQDLACILSVKNIQKEEDCLDLACVNKRLSVAVPYEYFRVHWNQKQYSSPLEQLLLAHDLAKDKPKANRYLRVAEYFLRNGANSNGFCIWFHCPLLHEASRRQNKDFARILLRYGADPYLKVSLNGHCHLFNAFHFEQQGLGLGFEGMVYSEYNQGNEPRRWLLELCREAEEGEEKSKFVKQLRREIPIR